MAVAMKSVASGAVRPARRTSVQCQAGLQKTVPAVIATVAAASLVATPAFAGVILQKQELKKVFQDDAPAAAVSKPASSTVAELPAAKPAPAPKAESSSGEGFSIDPQVVALPLSIAAVGGGFFALSKVDSGFSNVLWSGLLKDSNVEGAGYEVELKTANGVSFKPGTKKVKAGTKKGSFFGKK